MPESPVIIVGGGASGLSAAGALSRQGIDAVVLEQDRELGATWARRYDRLHLHTVRGFSGLAHFPIPLRYPLYLSRDDVVAYLGEYARHFGLRIHTGTTVRRIRPSGGVAGGWTVETAEGEPWRGRVVVVATGQYLRPVLPPWPGRDTYAGRLLHSASYSNAAPFVGNRVLVVGAGNSGAEIATDLVNDGASYVAVSVRTPPPIVPRDPFGLPVQRTSILLSALPAAIANRIGWATARLALGDLTRYGMPQPDFAPYTTKRIPLIDVGFVDALKRGRVTVRPALERLTPTGAVFADGTSEPFDAVIAATGFTTGLESIVDAPGALDDLGEPRGASGEPTYHPGLYFIGFTHTLRGHLFEANRASRRLARHVRRYVDAECASTHGSPSTRTIQGVMNVRDRGRYHQLHPVKLLVDWSTAIVAGGLLWSRQPLAALAVGFGPSIAVTLVFLSGRFDAALEAIRSKPVARAIAPRLSADVNAIRFAGLAVSWAACWLHRAWLIPAGVLVIAAGWWLAWHRGESV